MKTSPASLRWFPLSLVALILVALLVVIVPSQTAQADNPDGDQSTLISDDGIEFQAESSQRQVSLPFRGTGVTTEKVTPERPLTGMPIPSQFPESVIGADGRTKVNGTSNYPNRAIAQLVMEFSNGTFICTGWFIGPHTLATAGHCVYDPNLGEFASSITVYPGRNGNSLPFGTAKAKHLYTTTCWANTGSPECDYGAIKINKDLGNTVGWFGYGYYSDNSKLSTKKVNVRGYPGDKPTGTMWTMKGPIAQVTNTRIGYSIDTYGGQSGSPVYGKFTFPSGVCTPCSVGIHTYGVGATPFTNVNSGTRISRTAFNNLQTWSSK